MDDLIEEKLVGRIVSLSRSAEHSFSKERCAAARLIAGYGVEGDAHAGERVKHRSRVAVDPTQPNLRQVHLIGGELLEELSASGFDVQPGDLGENVLTMGIDLHALPTGAVVKLGATARVRLTGLRNPCPQIEAFRTGLLGQVLRREEDGSLMRRAGVMGVVEGGGEVAIGDTVEVVLPLPPFAPLERV